MPARASHGSPDWEACHQLCRALEQSEATAGALLARMPARQTAIRQLAYRLYTVCECNKWAAEALLYNQLITSWTAIVDHSRHAGHLHEQTTLDL